VPSQGFASSGTFVPDFTGDVTVELWAAGGGGGNAVGSNARSGGGAGGQYVRAVVAVVSGVGETVTVPGTTAATGTGGDAWFRSAATVLAKGGAPGGNATAGTGAAGGVGATTGGIGTLVRRGGSGGAGTGSGVAGAGGGGAGTDNDGGDATTNTAGSGGADGGGNGGAAGGTTGGAGSTYGGGGGGAAANNATNRLGGTGAAGYVLLTWDGAPPEPNEGTALTPVAITSEATGSSPSVPEMSGIATTPVAVATQGIGTSPVTATPYFSGLQLATGASGDARTVNAPTGVVEGERLVLIYQSIDTVQDSNLVKPTGWSFVGRAGSVVDAFRTSLLVYEKIATASEPGSYTFSGGTPGNGWQLAIYRTNASALRFVGAFTDDTLASFGTTTLTAVEQDSLVLSVWSTRGTAVTYTIGSQYTTARWNGGTAYAAATFAQATTANAGGGTAPWLCTLPSGTRRWAQVTLAHTPPVVTADPPVAAFTWTDTPAAPVADPPVAAFTWTDAGVTGTPSDPPVAGFTWTDVSTGGTPPNLPPATPTIDAVVNANRTATLSSTYSDPDNDAHAASRWRVYRVEA
jgi:hypothetical protein